MQVMLNCNSLFRFKFKYPLNEEFSQISLQGYIYPSQDTTMSLISICYPSSSPLSVSPYTLQLPVSPFSLPYTLTYQYSNPGYSSVQRKVQIGGLPIYSYIISSTVMMSSSINPVRITIKAINLRGSPINKFSIDLRQGYNNFTGPNDTFTFENSEGVLLLPTNIYSIVGRSEGFKHDYIEISDKISAVLLFTPDDFDDDEVRATLGWYGDVDIDLRLWFILNEDYQCDISYTNKICGGGRLTAASQSGLLGGEEISIKSLGAYQYLFYVKEFSYGQDKLRLINSTANLKFYVKDYPHPVIRITEQNEYPWNVSSNDYKIWMGACINGIQGITSLAPIQAFVSVSNFKSSQNVCSNIYGRPKIYKPEEKVKIEVENSINQIPKNIISYS